MSQISKINEENVVIFLSLTGNARKFANFAAEVLECRAISFSNIQGINCQNLLIVTGTYMLSNMWWLLKTPFITTQNLATCSLFSISKGVAQRAKFFFKSHVKHENYYDHYIEVGYFPLLYWTKDKPYSEDYIRFKKWLLGFKHFCEQQN